MTPPRSTKAFIAGADIVSAVTDITLNPDPEARIKEWLEITKNNV
jgi:thiamine-phosphate pyrophosphorylase